jgi:hypothetical protein
MNNYNNYNFFDQMVWGKQTSRKDRRGRWEEKKKKKKRKEKKNNRKQWTFTHTNPKDKQ